MCCVFLFCFVSAKLYNLQTKTVSSLCEQLTCLEPFYNRAGVTMQRNCFCLNWAKTSGLGKTVTVLSNWQENGHLDHKTEGVDFLKLVLNQCTTQSSLVKTPIENIFLLFFIHVIAPLPFPHKNPLLSPYKQKHYLGFFLNLCSSNCNSLIPNTCSFASHCGSLFSGWCLLILVIKKKTIHQASIYWTPNGEPVAPQERNHWLKVPHWSGGIW